MIDPYHPTLSSPINGVGLDLSDLKQRAFQVERNSHHVDTFSLLSPFVYLQFIIKSLTVENVPYEVFSTFSTAYEEVRKVE